MLCVNKSDNIFHVGDFVILNANFPNDAEDVVASESDQNNIYENKYLSLTTGFNHKRNSAGTHMGVSGLESGN